MLSVQAKAALSKQIDQLRSANFDEGEVLRILIGLREELPGNSMLRDLANFIHADRSKGPCWEHVSRFHACCSMIRGAVQPQLDAVPRNIFEFCLHELEQTTEEQLKEKAGARKDVVLRELKRRFSLDGRAGVYRLKAKIHGETVRSLQWISGILRVSPAFRQEAVIAQLGSVLESIEPGSKFVVEANAGEIVLCLLALLHQTRFILYGGAIAETSIGTEFDLELKQSFASANVVVPAGPLDWRFSFRLFQTRVNAEDYFSPELFAKSRESLLGPGIAVQTARDGRLILDLAP